MASSKKLNQMTPEELEKAKEEYVEEVTQDDEKIIEAGFLPEGLVEIKKKDRVNGFFKQLALRFKAMLSTKGVHTLGFIVLGLMALNYVFIITYESTTDIAYLRSESALRIGLAFIVCSAGSYFFRKKSKKSK